LHNLCTDLKAADPNALRTLLLIGNSRLEMMRGMMRIRSGIICALTGASLFVACSFGGSSGPEPDASTGGGGAHCGDGVCAASEVNSCPSDCGGGGSNQNAVCGNGMCETTKGETAQSCPSDCMTTGGGSGSGSGGGMCPADQTACINCIIDMTQCTGGLDQNTCFTCLLGGLGSGGGGGSGACNFNLMCDPGEDASTCPTDCM
jgi:hypothetical protein